MTNWYYAQLQTKNELGAQHWGDVNKAIYLLNISVSLVFLS